MLQCPQLDQPSCRSRSDLAAEQIAVEIKSRMLALMFRMEMRGRVIAEIHPDNYAEKRRDLWHGSSPLWLKAAYSVKSTVERARFMVAAESTAVIFRLHLPRRGRQLAK